VSTPVVDNSDVRKKDFFAVQSIEYAIQIGCVSKVFERMGECGQLEIGGAFLEKQFHDLAMIFGEVLKVIDHPRRRELGIIGIDAPAHQDERKNRTDQRKKNKSPVELGICFFLRGTGGLPIGPALDIPI
jgi:hypothetical protein